VTGPGIDAPALDVREVKERALAFAAELEVIKLELAPREFWYPYPTLGNLDHLDALLTGERRALLALTDGLLVADIGGADGDLSFLLERLGCRVHLIDNAPTNYNGLRGARMLKVALSSSVEIFDADLDGRFVLPGARYGTIFLLGILYHLKNPFYALESFAKAARYCFVSTKVARLSPDKRTELRDLPLAYLLDAREANDDPTNYWVFTEAGLKRFFERSGWRVLDFITVGNTVDSDPASVEGDERAFCLLESASLPQGQ
jgi:tRNA (mo5U34)-methyltransferase